MTASQPALVTVQLCCQHLQNPLHFDKLQKLLQPYQPVLHRLALGFAEFELLKLNNSNLHYLGQLKRLGVRLALEHFGAEAMPLGLLIQYPFDL